MVNQNGNQDLGTEEIAVAVDGGDAIAVAIEHQPHLHVALRGKLFHGLQHFAQVLGQGLGGVAAKQRVGIAV